MTLSGAPSFEFHPVAFVRSPLTQKADAPRQSRAAEGIEGRVEFLPGKGFEDALRDIDGFDYLWLIFVFDRAEGWRPTVLPPRSDHKRGVFATRAPRRPNPIGLSAVRLVRREGLTLHVADLDLLDGTPVLDVKPYVGWADAIPDASSGWLSSPDDPGQLFSVLVSAHAETQLQWLDARGVALRTRVVDHLSIGPRPHAYRRIREHGEGFVLSVQNWRVHFRIDDSEVHIDRLMSGIRPRNLANPETDPNHREFAGRFGADGKKE